MFAQQSFLQREHNITKWRHDCNPRLYGTAPVAVNFFNGILQTDSPYIDLCELPVCAVVKPMVSIPVHVILWLICAQTWLTCVRTSKGTQLESARQQCVYINMYASCMWC